MCPKKNSRSRFLRLSFTARCTLVQSAVLRLHVVRLFVCPSVCDVGGSIVHRAVKTLRNCSDRSKSWNCSQQPTLIIFTARQHSLLCRALSHTGIVSKRLELRSCCLHCRIHDSMPSLFMVNFTENFQFQRKHRERRRMTAAWKVCNFQPIS